MLSVFEKRYDLLIVIFLSIILYGQFVFGDGVKYIVGLMMVYLLIASNVKFIVIPYIEKIIAIFFISISLIIIFHIGDSKTIVSAVSIFLMYIGSLAFCYLLANRDDSIIKTFLSFMPALLIVSFLASCFFTSIGHLDAPSMFVWQQIAVGARLKLMSPDYTGHSSLITLSSIWLIYSLVYLKNKTVLVFNSLFAILILILSGTRTGLLLAIYIPLVWIVHLYYKKFIYTLSVVLVLPVLFLIFTIFPTLLNDLADSFDYLIQIMGFESIIRIDGDISTGRSDLNKYIIGLIKINPFFGLGNSSNYLSATIGSGGEFSFDGASTESIYRIPAKHGLVYFFVLLSFLLTPIFTIVKSTTRETQLVTLLVLTLVFILMINGGVLENFFGDSWILIALINALLLDSMSHKHALGMP